MSKITPVRYPEPPASQEICSANDRSAALAPFLIGGKWLKQIISKSNSASFCTDFFASSMSRGEPGRGQGDPVAFSLQGVADQQHAVVGEMQADAARRVPRRMHDPRSLQQGQRVAVVQLHCHRKGSGPHFRGHRPEQGAYPAMVDGMRNVFPGFSAQVGSLHPVRRHRRPGGLLKLGHSAHVVRMPVGGNQLPYHPPPVAQCPQVIEQVAHVKQPPAGVHYRGRRSISIVRRGDYKGAGGD